VAYIGMMSVDPKRQRRGIASKLMERALAALEERGCTVVLLDASDSGAPLYEGLGFVDDSIAQFFERVATVPLESPSSDVRISLASSVTELVAFDTPVFGGCRQKLFEVLWPEQQGRCLVARDRNGAMLGYLMARDPTLGPWAALHEEAAEALLRAALELPFEHMPHVYLPRSNEQSAALLRRYGFVARRSLRHMRLGGTCPPGQPEKLYGQSSFGHG
jgi:ribosomal protein S18 acetylase RimI-like enzyme